MGVGLGNRTTTDVQMVNDCFNFNTDNKNLRFSLMGKGGVGHLRLEPDQLLPSDTTDAFNMYFVEASITADYRVPISASDNYALLFGATAGLTINTGKDNVHFGKYGVTFKGIAGVQFGKLMSVYASAGTNTLVDSHLIGGGFSCSFWPDGEFVADLQFGEQLAVVGIGYKHTL